MWLEILLSFSLRRNVATIFDQSVGADTIPTIHGLRSISMGWVILGHTCIVAFKYSGELHLCFDLIFVIEIRYFTFIFRGYC